jgi:uncharacterized protein YbjT (DUF2867 family)
MILVTGAGGKTGQAILRNLLHRDIAIRALYHRPEQAEELQHAERVEVRWGDLRQLEVIEAASAGVDAIYHICANMSPDELAIGERVISAAQKNRVQRLIYHSVLHPHIQEMPHHWAKLQVEAAIFKSGLEYTILQPTAYMQNLLAYWPRMTHEGIFPVPYAAETRLSLVDLEDVGEAAAEVLCNPCYAGGIFELVGTPPLSQSEVAEVISTILLKPVRVESVPRDDWERAAKERGMGAYSIQTLLQMFAYYEAYGMWGSPAALESILNRKPTRLDEFVRKVHGG